MGLTFRRSRKLGKTGSVNLSKSGASLSKRAGPFTLNSRGRGSVRLGRGVSYRFRLFK